MSSPLIDFANKTNKTLRQSITTQHEQLDYELARDLAEAIHDEILMVEKRIMENINKKSNGGEG